MYTTLDFLKSNAACTPGFGRMLRFFGTKFDRFEKIPLHVVSLVGGYTDAGWTIESALIIDPEQYAEFRARTLPPMIRKAIKGTDLFKYMRTAALAQQLPFAGSTKPRPRTPARSAPPVVPKDTLKDKLRQRLYTGLWHVTGFDSETLTPPPHAEVQEFVDFINSIPTDMVSTPLLRLINKSPLEYIQDVNNSYRHEFIERDGTTDGERLLLCDERQGTDGYILAKILQPTDTLKFMTTMDYKPRIDASNVERLPGGKVRVQYEMDVESLDYLAFIRQQSDRSPAAYRDQDKIDEETRVRYPTYTDTPVTDEVTGVAQYQYVEVTRPAYVLDDEEEEEEEEEEVDFE